MLKAAKIPKYESIMQKRKQMWGFRNKLGQEEPVDVNKEKRSKYSFWKYSSKTSTRILFIVSLHL